MRFRTLMIILCMQSMFAMEEKHGQSANPPAEVEMSAIPRSLAGKYEKYAWNNQELLIVEDYARLIGCAVMAGTKITVKEKATLCLMGCNSMGQIYLEPKSILQLYDKSMISDVVRARNAVVIRDETISIQKENTIWYQYAQGFVQTQFYKQINKEEPFDGYPVVILYDKRNDKK